MEGANVVRTVNETYDQVSNIGSEKDVEEDDEFDWELGETTGLNAVTSGEYEKNSGKGWNGEVSLSVNAEECSAAVGTNGTIKRKSLQRRATAQDKEYSELIHKAHLLCLLARGRVVDVACDDPLLQASLLSLVPPSLSVSADVVDVPTTRALGGFVSWFMRSFRVAAAGEGPSSSNQGPSQDDFTTRLRHCIEKQAGSSEEVAALAVALLRSLGFVTRYVTILDVASLKPDAESLQASGSLGSRLYEQGAVFSSQGDLKTTRVASLAQILAHSVPQTVSEAKRKFSLGSDRGSPSASGACQQDLKPSPRGRGKKMFSVDGDRRSPTIGGPSLPDSKPIPSGRGKAKGAGRGQVKSESASGVYERPHEPDVELTETKRSGDEEFERQLAMAIAATAAEAEAKKLTNPETSGGNVTATPQPHASDARGPLKRIKGLGNSGNASLRQKLGLAPKQEVVGSNGAVWSRKYGPVMHWAEVYCSEEGGPGRWVQVDAARGIVDGADKIEGAAAACRLPLRYVVAFAGSGAKDVTRRYVTLWSTVDRHRVDQNWWDNTLNPLKQLEAVATAGSSQTFTSLPSTSSQAETATKGTNGWTSKPDIHDGDRSALEEMELETKTFTEPLPTNQQAYKSHHLCVLEKWLTKYQTLYPKGPILGYCAGHPVYPRACVQVLHTPDYWLREGFKVKSGETPAKFVKASRFVVKKEVDSVILEQDGEEEKKEEKMTALYGKWQTHPWQPPRAVDGKVPRNERGQVDVWSEKCIPPGTVHLRFQGLVPVAQKLGIDFSPAMVGFEVRKGRTFPVYDGIVVCEEFKDLIMDAFTVHEEARFSELWKKREEHAAKRWRHLLHSMATRQRLQTAYEVPAAVATKPKHRQTFTSSKALPIAEPLKSATDSAFPIDSQSDLTKKKGAQKQGPGLHPQHVHQFPEENQSYDEDTGIRTKVCGCGFTYSVEEM